jgi:MFS family permease
VSLSEAAAAMVLSAWIAGNIVLQIPLGWAADRFGRRGVTVACTVLSLLSLAVVGPAVAHPWLLWPTLALMGGVMGGLYTLAMALLGQSFKGSEMAAAATGFVVVFEVGAVLGPAILGGGIDAFGAETLPWLSMVPLLALLAVAPRLRAPVA